MKTAFTYNIVRRWAFLGATLLLILANYLSNSIPIGGRTMAEVSGSYPTLITPAGYAFSIWGVIYLTLFIFAIFQLRRGRASRFYNLVWPFFILNVFANITWLIVFQTDLIGLSVIVMLVLLYSLFRIFKLFYRFKDAMGTTRRFFFQVPFSLYFGWVSVATIINIAIYLSSLNIDLMLENQALFGLLMIIVAAVLGLAIVLAKHDYVFGLAISWALIAIWAGQTELTIVVTAKFAAIGLIATMVSRFVSRRVKLSRYGKARVNS